MLGGYEQALPGCAERIVAMAEREQQHRHALEQADFSTRSNLARWGQRMAFFLGATGMIGGLLLAGFDKSLAGLAAFFTSLATLVGVYVYTQRKARE